MPYRNKTYVCFDADSDIHYYRMMQAWKQSDNHDFNFYNSHDLGEVKDGDSEEKIKRILRDRFANSKILIVLIGEKTKNLYKFVRWEIEVALELDIPVICVNLNGSKNIVDALCPPILRDELAIHIPFKLAVIQYALDNWAETHAKRRKEGISEGRVYNDSVYTKLGI